VKILRATFEAPSRLVDVTPAVRGLVTELATPFSIDGQSLELDLWPGIPKWLAVWFDDRGKRYVRLFREGECRLMPQSICDRLKPSFRGAVTGDLGWRTGHGDAAV
jgi:hypothetical protein